MVSISAQEESMSKATPWKWHNEFPEDGTRYDKLISESGETILECWASESVGDSGIAVSDEHATLISRAPALRDALRDLLEAMPSCPGTVVSGSGGHTVHANDCGKPATHGCDGSLFGYCADHAGTHDEPDWWHDAVARIRAALDGL